MATRTERLALLAFIISQGEEKLGIVGHTLVQKLFYLLETANKGSLGYKYRLYHYGPYCSELWSDLNRLKDIGFLDIDASPKGMGYQIKLTENGKKLIQEHSSFLMEYRQNIDQLIEIMGGEPVRKLEALATAHYLYCDEIKKQGVLFEEVIIKQVLDLKPHLSYEEVEQALLTLKKNGLLQ